MDKKEEISKNKSNQFIDMYLKEAARIAENENIVPSGDTLQVIALAVAHGYYLCLCKVKPHNYDQFGNSSHED